VGAGDQVWGGRAHLASDRGSTQLTSGVLAGCFSLDQLFKTACQMGTMELIVLGCGGVN
jgi:hypothetical protein